jgi:hypothetical protein
MTMVADTGAGRLAHRGRASEIYQARDRGRIVALKVVAAAHAVALSHESAILAILAGAGAPESLGIEPAGTKHMRLRSTWVAGVHATSAAEELRGAGGPGAAGLLELCCAVLDAYAALHDRGVTHEQPHPRHVLVDAGGAVKLVDFARAAGPGVPPPVERCALNAMLAPEDARARLAGSSRAAPTPLREQYSLAALVYLLLTGHVHVDLPRDAPSALRQIASHDPRSFRDRGCEPWPALERVLGRALATRPDDRFASVDELAAALRATAPGTQPARPRRLVQAALARHAADVLAATDLASGHPTIPAPSCSVYAGCAGVALAVARLAQVTGDSALAERAVGWTDLAEKQSADRDAFDDDDGVSPFHSLSGLHCVRASIARDRDDAAVVQDAVEAFVRATSTPCAGLDLTTGRAAVLLGCALLHDLAAGEDRARGRLLRDHGDRIHATVWQDGVAADMEYLGIAHGTAGVLYATLQWARTRGLPPPRDVGARLDDLAARAEAIGRGWRWPARRVAHDGETYPFRSGWCHGGAGYVALWTLAHEVLGDTRYLDVAERAAWGVWEAPLTNGGLCCGAAGQAYALLNIYRHTGDDAWLQRAATIANVAADGGHAPDDPGRPLSLFKGHVGLALVAAELTRPGDAAMPFFEQRRAGAPPPA